ncbi:MAG: hypothetical protein H5U21_02215 [Porphyrobacter sp.]|nr:hypothetical protein [Porphyrobacter sp.]
MVRLLKDHALQASTIDGGPVRVDMRSANRDELRVLRVINGQQPVRVSVRLAGRRA